MARGDGWKRNRWGGGGGSWRTNYRGWLRKSAGGSSWGRGFGGMGGRWSGNSNWAGRAKFYSSMTGSYGNRSLRGGLHSSFGSSGGHGRGSGMLGMLRAITGATGAFSRGQSMPDDPGGLLSSSELNISPNSGTRPASALPDEMDFEAIRKRCKETITTLARRYADGDAKERQEVAGLLVEIVGPKYGKLVTDWAGQDPAPDEYAPFITYVVEAAAFDGGREPISWKIQRLLRWLMDRIRGKSNVKTQVPQQA